MKPQEYRNPIVLTHDAVYLLVDDCGVQDGMPQTGTFKTGRVVWLPASSRVKALKNDHVLAWAEGTGTVSISQNALPSSR